MRSFEKRLLRLKHALGLTEDQQVAAVLGMSKAAFFERKKRDSFPEEKLYALAAQHPEYNLDIDYVLSGTSDKQKELNRRLLALKEATQKAGALGLPRHYTLAVQEVLFFVELEDAAGVMNAFKELCRQIAAEDAGAPGESQRKKKSRKKT